MRTCTDTWKQASVFAAVEYELFVQSKAVNLFSRINGWKDRLFGIQTIITHAS